MTQAQPSPEMIAVMQRVREIGERLGPPPADVAALGAYMRQAGAWWNEGGPAGVSEADIVVETAAGPLSGRLYRPDGATDRPLWVYLHGGGFKFGGVESNARQLREIAALWGGAILSLNYPHLPQGVFPMAVDQVADAYHRLVGLGEELGFDGDRIAWGGNSAGASISAGAAVAAGSGGADFLRAGVLISPVVNGASDTESMRAFGDGPWFPTRQATVETWRDYMADWPDALDPRADLLQADPRLLAPLFIASAEIDVFASGARRLAQSLEAACVPVIHRPYAGATHLFFNYSRMLPAAQRCVADIAEFLSGALPARRVHQAGV